MNKRREAASHRKFNNFAPVAASVMARSRQHGSTTVKYAIVDEQRREALRGLRGTCPICDALLTPKCGRFRVAHWAHSPGITDHRWEPETEWHRTWKGCFPRECQEVVHQASDGKRHIADVKTARGQVIEFQHSPISEEERCSREKYYRPMLWVVNGQRLKGERSQFSETLRSGTIASANPLMVVVPVENCMLLRKWADSRVLVLFDFGETDHVGDVLRFGAPVLWASDPRKAAGKVLLTPVYRSAFIEAMTKGEPLKGMNFSKVFGQPLRRPAPQIIVARPAPWNPRPRKNKRYNSRKWRAWSGSSKSSRRRWSRMG